MRIWIFLCVAGTVTGCVGWDVEDDPTVVTVEDERAFAISWDDYRSRATPLEDGGFVAEWDLMFPDEGALREHYEELVLAEKSKLVVIRRQSDGFEPTFNTTEQVELKYCVSNSFSNKSTVVSHMAEGAKGWQGVTRVRFVYVPSQDASCTQNNANVQFAVMPSTASFIGCAANKKMWSGVLSTWGCRTAVGQPYINGVVLLNYSGGLPSGQTWPGVVRHELGHLLGFRHEHPWDPTPSCGEQQTYAAPADLGGRQLTSYDVASVMHYQSCGGLAGTDYVISPLDGEGSRSIYGMPAAWYVPIMGQ